MLRRFELDAGKAVLVARAEHILRYCEPRHLIELRDLLRQCVAGQQPAAVDAALVALFADVQVCHDVLTEHRGMRTGEKRECPF